MKQIDTKNIKPTKGQLWLDNRKRKGITRKVSIDRVDKKAQMVYVYNKETDINSKVSLKSFHKDLRKRSKGFTLEVDQYGKPYIQTKPRHPGNIANFRRNVSQKEKDDIQEQFLKLKHVHEVVDAGIKELIGTFIPRVQDTCLAISVFLEKEYDPKINGSMERLYQNFVVVKDLTLKLEQKYEDIIKKNEEYKKLLGKK